MNKKLPPHRILLSLRRETVRPLNEAGLAGINGGAITFPTINLTCPSAPSNCDLSACGTCPLTTVFSKAMKGTC